jgi:response regulator RpfG family c-di-GMP phosphodiesterase
MAQNKKLGEILIELGFVTHEQLNAALLHQKKSAPQKKLGGLLVELGLLDEVDLLKCLSGLFRVRYISSDKLATLNIPRWILDLVPADFAETHRILPFFCYDKTRVLSVLISDPQDKKIFKLIRKVSGYDVETYLALEIAIAAGIAKFYNNNEESFQDLRKQLKAGFPPAVSSFVPSDQQLLDNQYIDPNKISSQQDLLVSALSGKAARQTGAATSGEEEKKRLSDHISPLSVMSEDTFIELFNVVISVLELYKGEEYRGHSPQVAKLVKQVSQAYCLPVKDTYYNVLCGYLHDCCLNAPEHLTLLHSESKQGSELLEKYSGANQRLFEKARLPDEMGSVLFHTFERFDGKGFPEGLKGEAIPLGARIIAAVDSFVHLTDSARKEHARNPYRDALQQIHLDSDLLFDPQVVARLEEVVSDYLVNEDSPCVVVVDADFENLDYLTEKLKKSGIRMYTSQDTGEAQNFIRNAPVPVRLVISEVTTLPEDGFAFCAYIKTTYPDMRFIFLSEQLEPNIITKGFDLGADDFITKPCNPDILFAKVQNFVRPVATVNEERSGLIVTPQKRGVTGNLAEIRVTDLIQMLFSGRKTGTLKLFKEDETGQISFDRGEIIHAQYNKLSAVEAFNHLVRWEHGLFRLDPDEELPQQMIFESTEHLLLEAYRLWDEEAMQEQ